MALCNFFVGVLCLAAQSCLFATPWTVAHHTPLSMEFFRPEYWSGLPCPPPGDLPNPGIQPKYPTLQAEPKLRLRLYHLSQSIPLCLTSSYPEWVKFDIQQWSI